MWYGCDKKLKDHAASVDLRIASINNRLNSLDTDYHAYKVDCQEHRRLTDAWSTTMTASQQKTEVSLENTERNVGCIKNILETYLPNLKDAEEKRAAKHQIKETALWVSAVLGALMAIFGAMTAVWLYLSGYLNSLVS